MSHHKDNQNHRRDTGSDYVYDVMVTILKTERTMKEMRVEKLWPGTNWNRVRKNLWAAPVPDDKKTRGTASFMTYFPQMKDCII
jgi:hypothetical protein